MIKKTPVGSTPQKIGWSPTFAVCSPEDGWSRKFFADDPTLTTVAICRTRDEDGKWHTFYRQVVTKKELKKMRVRLKRLVEKAQREEVRKFGRRVFF